MREDRLPPDVDWLAHYGMTRRRVLATSAATIGFAAACQPVSSSTQMTDAEGLATGTASTPGADGFAIPLFYARPEGTTPRSLIIVVHEIFGVHEWIKDICRRLAHAGYMAVAPDLFARAGDATKIPQIDTLIKTIVSKTPDDQVLSDIDRAVAWAGDNGATTERVGITGFCWGGRVVWLYAAHSPNLDAGVAFYGRLTGEQPLTPLKLADKLKAPVLGQYGALDKGIPVADVEAMNAALKAAGSPSHIQLYPQADHGFMADYRPSFNEESATVSWRATLDWFGKYVRLM